MPREFFFRGKVVGYFQQDAFPDSPGSFRYMPYRGPGHYGLATVLQSGASAKCSFIDRDRIVEFSVSAIPEYGVLWIDELYTAAASRG